MTILAFDTASVACSACVWQDGQVKASAFLHNGMTHSQTLLPAVDYVLRGANVKIEDVDLLVFTGGPGSFTGVKICISLVKGLALKHSIPCRQLSVTEVLAYALHCDGVIVPVQDARRNMVYNALFRWQDGRLVRLCEDRQIGVPELLAELTDVCHIVGDGMDLLQDSHHVLCGENYKYVRAEVMAEMAADGYGFAVDSKQILPAYLRPPQAERERLERLKKENI